MIAGMTADNNSIDRDDETGIIFTIQSGRMLEAFA
jgi:hypothetical protein